MGFIIAMLVRLITFPGVIVNLVITQLTAKLLKIELLKTNYKVILVENPLELKESVKYYKLFLFALIPFIVLTLLSVPFLFNALQIKQGIGFLFFMWLGVSIAAHSFPEMKVGKMIWIRTNKEIKNKNYVAIFGYPFALFIYLIKILHVLLWLDVLYGIGLMFLLEEYYF